MTATRLLKGATIVLAVAAWLVAAALLWRTKVPADLHRPRLGAAAFFSASELHRAARYSSVGQLLFLLGVGMQLAVLAVLALLGRRLTRGFALGEVGAGVMIGVAASLFVTLATLPVGLLGLWWDRRYGISKQEYWSYVVGQWGSVLARTATVAIVLAVVMSLARRFARGWWAIVAPMFVIVGAVFVLVGSLLAPIGTHPIPDRRIAAAVERLEQREGVPDTKVRVDRVSGETRAVNGETTGLGPTTVVILWDTLFRSHLSDRAIEFVTAHELGHAARRHIWKGLGWGLLFTVPLTFLLAAATRRRGGLHRAEVVPFALFVASALGFTAMPLENVVSRRYESEADWMALQSTRDPGAGREAFRSFTQIDLAQPNPPGWSYVVLDDHPTVMQRLAMTEAWSARTSRLRFRATSPPLRPVRTGRTGKAGTASRSASQAVPRYRSRAGRSRAGS
jgi:STE24 endopeptidase